jgi:hypothetical protein
MRFLPLISCLFLLACSSPYRNLQQVSADLSCVQHLKPVFGSVLYKTNVSVVGKQLSGLLLIKTMPDSSVHIAFTSETGITFFNFSFLPNGEFLVHYIIRQMDKKAVIKTLRKDFEMILWKNTASRQASVWSDGRDHYYKFPQQTGAYYYITDSACSRVERIERASDTKVIVQAFLNDLEAGVPRTMEIRHKNIHFTIILKRVTE